MLKELKFKLKQLSDIPTEKIFMIRMRLMSWIDVHIERLKTPAAAKQL